MHEEIAVGVASSKKIAQVNAAQKAIFRLKYATPGSEDAKLIEKLTMQATMNEIEKIRGSRENEKVSNIARLHCVSTIEVPHSIK